MDWNWTWKDELLSASFRDIEFKVESHSTSSGRRVAVHQIPGSDKPYTEDMGKDAQEFSITGYIVDENYMAQRDKLFDAMTKEGPGTLVHPYLGYKYVQPTKVSFSEKKSEGGYVEFSLTFIETSDEQFPFFRIDNTYNLKKLISDALGKVRGAFATITTIANMPGHIVEALRTGVSLAGAVFEAVTSPIAAVADAAANLSFSIRNLSADIDALMKAPDKLGQRLQDSIQMLVDASSNNKDKAKALEKLARYGRDKVLRSEKKEGDNKEAIPADTPTRIQEMKNNNALNALIRQTATLHACAIAAETQYESEKEALEAREKLIAHLDQHLLSTTDDDLYDALSKVRMALVDAVPSESATYANSTKLTLDDTTPALVAGYMATGRDISDKLIERNAISNPCFIPQGTTLEILDE